MSAKFGADWQVVYDYPGKFALDDKDGFGLAFYNVTAAKLADPKDGHLIPFPEDFLAWLKSNPDFDAVKSTPVTVAGIEGLQIDATPIWKSTTSKFKSLSLTQAEMSREIWKGSRMARTSSLTGSNGALFCSITSTGSACLSCSLMEVDTTFKMPPNDLSKF